MEQIFRAGDYLSFLLVSAAYKASDGWQAHYRLVPRDGSGAAINFDSTAEGDNHRFTVAATTTAGWVAGAYAVVAWVTKGNESYTVREGQTTIRPDMRTATPGTDTRSFARRALEDCKSALATFRATRGMTKRYRIGEREMEFSDTAQILREIKYWESEVNKEDVAAGFKSAFSGRIAVRL